MGKLKTKSSLTKRIKITSSKKIKRGQAFRSHLAQNKTTKQKRQSKKSKHMSPSDMKRFNGMY